MEKLSAAQQQQLKKMSNEHFYIKLMGQGSEEDIVIGMETEELIATYAELLASGKLKVSPGAIGGVGYDPEVEKILAFEKQKWEAEQRKWEAEMEEKRPETEEIHQREQREVEERRRREEREDEFRRQEAVERRQREVREEERRQEADERRRRSLLEAEQVELRKRGLERQTARDKAEDERKYSAVAKGILFGDAMHLLYVAIRMGADPIELISFLRNCEQLFGVSDVPDSLQAILTQPFLNDRACTYLIKLYPQVSGDYKQLKDAFLQEFKLSANVYLERFNMCMKSPDDTYVSFASKLTGLLDYYHESKHATIYEQQCELLVCDRIKCFVTGLFVLYFVNRLS